MDRREQNRVYKEWNAFKKLVTALDERIVPVLLRGTYESGVRVLPRSAKRDPEARTQDLAYSDETGEMAVRYELPSSVNNDLRAIAEHITNALNTARGILGITPSDASERAKRSVPDCVACGDPASRVRSGFDDKCYKRWLGVRSEGKLDRAGFIALVKSERLNTLEQKS